MNKLCLAKLLKEKNILFSEGYCAEDMIFTIALKCYAEKFVYLNEKGYNYLQRRVSLTHNKSLRNLAVPQFLQDTKNLLERTGIFSKTEDDFYKFALSLSTMHYRKVPQEACAEYKKKCEQFFPQEWFVKFDKYTKNKNWFQKMFSLGFNGKNYELIVLGIKIKFK